MPPLTRELKHSAFLSQDFWPPSHTPSSLLLGTTDDDAQRSKSLYVVVSNCSVAHSVKHFIG